MYALYEYMIIYRTVGRTDGMCSCWLAPVMEWMISITLIVSLSTIGNPMVVNNEEDDDAI
jgi:hypothetical protein